jgi:hypothetical protein
MPSTHKGWITYHLTGVIHVLVAYGEMLASRGQCKLSAPPRHLRPMRSRVRGLRRWRRECQQVVLC